MFNTTMEGSMNKFFTGKWAVTMLSAAGLSIVAFGCASAKINMLSKPSKLVVEPDFVLVNTFAVASSDIKVDSSAAAQAMRSSDNMTQAELESKIGTQVANAMADGIVENLRTAGIKAVRAGQGWEPTAKTLVLSGKFVQVNQGNQTMRVIIGFGMGSGDIKALIDCSQDGKLIASAMVTTSGSLKPGLLVPVAGGAAAGTLLVTSAVAGGATVVSETYMATLNADAQRAAKDVAKRIVQGYINHGWATPAALDKINALF